MKKGIFITGTDTGVGKTVVAATLASYLRSNGLDVGVMKPIQTGCRRTKSESVGKDADLLMYAAGVQVTHELVTPYCLKYPLAPWTASQLEGVHLKLSVLLKAYHQLRQRYTFLVVEGVGGLAVPITARLTVLDLAMRFELPLLVVARPGLGTLNHTKLTIDYAKIKKIPVIGVILNQTQNHKTGLTEKTNLTALKALCNVPILGNIPFIKDLELGISGFNRAIKRMRRHIRMETLMEGISLK
jgi:dethiobiotin synthetase